MGRKRPAGATYWPTDLHAGMTQTAIGGGRVYRSCPVWPGAYRRRCSPAPYWVTAMSSGGIPHQFGPQAGDEIHTGAVAPPQRHRQVPPHADFPPRPHRRDLSTNSVDRLGDYQRMQGCGTPGRELAEGPRLQRRWSVPTANADRAVGPVSPIRPGCGGEGPRLFPRGKQCLLEGFGETFGVSRPDARCRGAAIIRPASIAARPHTAA